MRKTTAIALLTWQPSNDQLNFFKGFVDYGYDVYAVVDSDEWQSFASRVRFVKIPVQPCSTRGFKHLNPVITESKKSPCSAWEKALYYFSCMSTQHDYVWIIEDDVLVPSLEALLDIDAKYRDDLVAAEHAINWDGDITTWEWFSRIPRDRLPSPWAKSMVCAVRLSRALLSIIREFLFKNRDFDPYEDVARNRYFFIEILFNTLAHHHGLKVAIADELSTIVWRREWDIHKVDPLRLYHPVKDISVQSRIQSRFKLAAKRTGSGILPGDRGLRRPA